MLDNSILKLVIKTVQQVGEDQKNPVLINAEESTRLWGELDSMGVVYLLAELEDVIYEEYNLSITLADERAMSQKTSPFLSIKTLTKYINQLILEEKQVV